MVNLLEQPEQFKAELKDKWLDYYDANKNWIQALMDGDTKWYQTIQYYYEQEQLDDLGYCNYSPRRPNSFFILGVISSLEPQLKGLFAFIPKHSDDLLRMIALDFDPEIELKKRAQQQTQQQIQQQIQTDSQYLNQIREEIKT